MDFWSREVQMYCCDGFANLISCAGQRGHAIIAVETTVGQVRFLLQSRGLAFGDESKIVPVPVDVKVNISAEIGLRYCPSCGFNLEDLVRQNLSYFHDLAKQHKRFLPSI